MKYKFEVAISLTYWDKDIEVEVELSDNEVAGIKKLIAEDCEVRDKAELVETEDDDEYEENVDFVSPPDLLTILDENAPELFDKFWKVIFPPVFIENLIDGIKNYGDLVQLEDDGFDDYRTANFDEVFEMYGDSLDFDHYEACICKIPQDWMP